MILPFYTYMCTINEDHMIYGSWNIRCDKQIFFTFWAIFCPYCPLTTWKIKILTLKKNPGDIVILHISPYITIIWCMVPEIRSTTDIIFCHSGPFFALLHPMDLENQKILKNRKNTWRYYHLTNIYDSHMINCSSDLQCNGQNFLSFWIIFCPFTPKTTQKI